MIINVLCKPARRFPVAGSPGFPQCSCRVVNRFLRWLGIDDARNDGIARVLSVDSRESHQ